MLFDKLKADRMQAMKDKDAVKKDLLGTLIGEASKETKEPDDAKIIATIKKFIANAKGNLDLYVAKGFSIQETQTRKEIDILEGYLPTQLSEDGIRVGVKAAVNLGATSMGDIMKYMKENYEGRYDGKLASAIARELLS